MVLEGDFFGECVEANSCGAGGIYQMYRMQRSFTKRYSKSKAFALNLFAKAVLILYFVALLYPLLQDQVLYSQADHDTFIFTLQHATSFKH